MTERQAHMMSEKDIEKQDELEEELNDSAEETAEETEEKEEKENAEETAEEISEEDKLKAELAESKDKYLRLMAEYDNFRKRSAKERLELSAAVKGDTVSDILPVLDNFERALNTETEDEAYKQGIEMIFKQFTDALTKLGIEPIDPVGEVFDPNIANAVNQIEDPELGENVVAQVFQKGYRIGDKVIRYAMVVVANP
ncbi:nucleotide exchange factor GrpE [Ruminococcus albus]|uniref:Protein GrpE n=1 Tax=Ruminococcus albus 8 TaxID=246199 RepID=E9SCU9_RUMAL|nr:nucleotide exchange factor GrpE [Ruminococcus albus]EGC02923.1 co-chaperone GrpE [Ruminococcus albus 8]MCC3352465.1 nucleotide exchange factor GrpE [Ruminococcus albus 8]